MEPGQTALPGAAGKPGDYASESLAPAFLFDLDGTLVDSVYQHVLAWREALEQFGIELSVWKIHRRIGMSGGLFVNALLPQTGLPSFRPRTASASSGISPTCGLCPVPQRFCTTSPRWASPGPSPPAGVVRPRVRPWSCSTYRMRCRSSLTMKCPTPS